MSRRRRGSIYLRGGIGPLRFRQPISGRGIGGCLIVFVALALLGFVISAVGSCFSAVGVAINPPQVRHAAASPTPLATPSPSPSPSPAHIVFDIAGSGTGGDEEGISPLFYITPNSDWDLFWSYSCSSPGQVFFSVYVKDGDASTAAYGDWQDVLVSGLIGRGVMHAHDPGGHERVLRLSVVGPAAMRCAWTMRVTANSPTPPTRPAPSPTPRVTNPVPPPKHHDWF